MPHSPELSPPADLVRNAIQGPSPVGGGEGAGTRGHGPASGQNLRILLSPPDVGAAERAALLEAFDSNWISTAGPAITRFEDAMAEHLGRPCVALSSGTAALHLALRLAGVQPGDIVFCQSFTFVATANPILYEGAVPYFLDSEPRTWNLDAELLEEAIRRLDRQGKRARAVVAVHLYGTPAEIHRIAAVCERHGLALIEDAAEALGAHVNGQPVGRHGLAAAFSFNGNKIITTAGGGMLALASRQDADRVRKWSTQAREAALHYEHEELGFNYRMSNLLAALGTAQLAGLEAKVDRRRAIAAAYRDALSNSIISFPPEPPQSRSTHWLTCALLQPPGIASPERRQFRDALIAHLAACGIESRPLWKPMHLQPLYRKAPRLGGAVSESLFHQGICLPSSSALRTHEQAWVIEQIKQFLQHSGLDARRSPRHSLESLGRFTRDASRSPIARQRSPRL